MNSYIRGLGQDPDTAIRMSIIQGFPDKYQMVIPDAVMKARGGTLGIRTECKPKIEDFEGNTPEADYSTWPNVEGSPCS